MFGLNSTKKQTLTVKKPIEMPTEAKNKRFYSQFFTTKRVTRHIGYAGQLLSGITEAFTVFFLAGGDKALPFRENVLPLLLALAAVYVFEWLGVRVYLVRIVRQAIQKDFKSWQAATLFGFNVLLCLLMLAGNIATSMVSTVSFFEEQKQDNTRVAQAKIDSTAILEIEAIQLKYARLDSLATVQHNNVKFQIEREARSTASALANALYAARENQKQREDITASIGNATADKNAKLNAADSLYHVAMAFNADMKRKELERIEGRANMLKADLVEKHESKKGIMTLVGRFASVALVVFILVSVGAIVYEEIYYSGAEVLHEIQEKAVKPFLPLALIQGIWNHIYHAAYILTVRVVGTRAYEYTPILQDKDTFASTDVSPLPSMRRNESREIQVAGFQSSPSASPDASRNASAQPFEAQKDSGMQAYHDFLKHYNISSVRSWYYRSRNAPDPAARKRNAAKYNKVKSEYEHKGVIFKEGKSLTIRF